MDEEYISWLEKQSMLFNSFQLSKTISGSCIQWRHPYGIAHSKEACNLAPVWFTAYPSSIISKPGTTVIRSLADRMLWRAFREIGIQGMHTCPMRIAGGIKGRSHYQTVDGWFDRIGYEIDPVFGSEDDYGLLIKVAAENDAIIIDDIIPGHTGKGADFLLAALNYRSYPGIYHMIEISPKDWNLLPEVPDREDSVNLSPQAVSQLKDSNCSL
jgi:maltose alpha-D-glucosyltransferase/alpha-amylase